MRGEAPLFVRLCDTMRSFVEGIDMSAQVWAAVADLQMHPREKAVLLHLADQASVDGYLAMPDMAAVVRRTCWPELDVVDAIAALKRRGLIREVAGVERRRLPDDVYYQITPLRL